MYGALRDTYSSSHLCLLMPHGRYELNKLTSLPLCGFIAQMVEQRTGNAEVTGSNPVEALIFFRLLLSNCLNWKIYCDDHSSLSLLLLLTISYLAVCSNQVELKNGVMTTPKRRFFNVYFFFLWVSSCKANRRIESRIWKERKKC